MEELQEKTQVLSYVNAGIQLFAVTAFQQLGLIWPMYIIMGLLFILIAMQTIAAAAAFSQIVPTQSFDKDRAGTGIGILMCLLYMISCYHIYLIGFIGFAWVSFAHLLIHLFANILGAIKK